jgi:hypothetical protein
LGGILSSLGGNGVHIHPITFEHGFAGKGGYGFKGIEIPAVLRKNDMPEASKNHLSVRRYFRKRLFGLSGMVNSRYPELIAVFK